MNNNTPIPLQDGEVIIWQGKAAYPKQRAAEYLPLLISVVLFVNSCWLLYPAEPLETLHQFCSGNFVGGLLILFIAVFAVAPTVKRKLVSGQNYLFTNRRAISFADSTGAVIHTLPAEKLADCIIRQHGSGLISILEADRSGAESAITLLFACVPADILKHYPTQR